MYSNDFIFSFNFSNLKGFEKSVLYLNKNKHNCVLLTLKLQIICSSFTRLLKVKHVLVVSKTVLKM